MKFSWSTDTIRWYRDAEAYTHFFQNLASRIAPMLQGQKTFCDIGCGLGLIDLELTGKLERLTCVDTSAEALNTLRETILARGIRNIETLHGDARTLEGSWDVIYAGFFESHNLENYLPRCRDLIAVVSGTSESAMYPEKYKTFRKFAVPDVAVSLREKGIRFTLSETAFEFGQPFSSLAEAEAFQRTQSPDISGDDLGRFLSDRLVKTGETQFPYYLPRLKSLGIFEIKGVLG